MKIALEKVDGKLIAEHELSGADAADALDELFMLRAGGSLGDYLDSTKGKFFAEDLVHCLRRCALGGNADSSIRIRIAEDSGEPLGQHALTSNAARFALDELHCGKGYEPGPEAAEETIGRFTAQDILHMLRLCGRGVTQ